MIIMSLHAQIRVLSLRHNIKPLLDHEEFNKLLCVLYLYLYEVHLNFSSLSAHTNNNNNTYTSSIS